MATQAFGQYDLPIPRQDASISVLPSNIDRFAGVEHCRRRDADVVLAQELTGRALFSIASLRRTSPRWCVVTSAHSDLTPRQLPRSSRRSIPTTLKVIRCRRSRRCSEIRPCSWAPCNLPSSAAEPSLDAAAAASSGTSTTWSTVCRFE